MIAENDQETDISGLTLQTDLPALLKSIVEWAVELMRADAGEIYLWDPDIGALVQAISYGFVEISDGFILGPGDGMGGRVYQSGQPMIILDYGSWEGRAPNYTILHPYLCVLAVPLKWQDKIIGVMELETESRRRVFDQDDVRLATLFSNLAALAIKNEQLHQFLHGRSQALQRTLETEVSHRTAELRHRALQLETSARVSRQITAILDVDRLLPQIVELIREAFDYYSVSIFLVETDLNQLVLRATSGVRGRKLMQIGLNHTIDGKSLNSAAVLANKAFIVNDVSEEPNFLKNTLLPDTQSELVIPLQVGENVIGTMDVQSEKKNVFREEDVLVIESLGDQIAIAINNARLYDLSRELAILEERTRLARELHDSVAQCLFSIDLSARAVATYLKDDRQKADMELQELRRTAREALYEMRLLIFDLRPVSLEEADLVSAIRHEIKRLRRVDGPELLLQESGECSLPNQVKQELFRIAQEALRNAVKHANARHITVLVIMKPDMVELCVEDDGQGFDPEALESNDLFSYGLIGLRERVELFKGELEIGSQPGKGTRVQVRLSRRADIHNMGSTVSERL